MAEPIAPLPTPEPTPDAPPTATTAVLPIGHSEPPVPTRPRKRRRWWVLIVVLLLVAILLAIAFFTLERFGRDYAEQLVRDQVITVLKLEPDATVGVDLGEGSLIAQAIAGRIDTVVVDVPRLTLGGIPASAVLFATGVPLDSAQPVETMRVVATVTESNVNKLAGYLSASDLKSISLGEGVITVATEFTLLNLFVFPVTVDLEPSVVNGGISFDPKTIVLAGAEISVEDLRSSPEFSALAGDLLASRDFCVADQLPTALVLTDVTVVDSTLVLVVTGDGTALGDPALSQVGTCKQK